MKIIVTGATGHIGSYLIRDLGLQFKDSEIVMIDNMMTQRFASLFKLPKLGNYSFIEDDVRLMDLNSVFKDADIVIHLAAITDAAGSFDKAEEIEENNLVEESQRKGLLLHDGLNSLKEKYPERISYVFGKGMIASVLFKNPKTGEPDTNFSSHISETCMRKGLLVVHTGRDSIKILIKIY